MDWTHAIAFAGGLVTGAALYSGFLEYRDICEDLDDPTVGD